MRSPIKKVKFKAGLPLKIEILPIAETVLNLPQSITTPHRTHSIISSRTKAPKKTNQLFRRYYLPHLCRSIK